jgi:DNA topoisomerase-1
MPNKTLVIVESPAKCKKIESYLGPGYKVIASFGHLRTISGLESIDVKNHFDTKYSIIQEEIKQKQIEKIRSEIINADEVIIATDDDREGESIGWHICDLFGLNINHTKRIVFHEITETAIQTAISNPKTINIDLVHAQQARQILDLLVGFTISPMLWNCVSNGALSAGRCQTPALRLIYDNYVDIKQSPGKLVYNVSGYFTDHNILFHLNKPFNEEIQVKEFLEQCKTAEFIYLISSPKKTIKKPPEPLTTSSLQQFASNELHISPKETMKYAQQLYESGYITYMRTDSKKYSQEFLNKTKRYIENEYGNAYINPHLDLHLDLEKQSNIQEAHEAIRPVNIHTKTPTLDDPKSKAIRLYELIWRRTLESCMHSAQYNSITAKINAPLDSEFVYKTEQPIFLGWQIINHKETDDNNYYSYLQTLKQNVPMKPKKIDAKFALVDLKQHYTEARLVQLLEEKGIGRPSTFASLVDKIQERKYVEKQNINGKEIDCVDFSLVDNVVSTFVSKREFGNEKNKLVILPLGIIVIEFLMEHFNTFFNYNYTEEMENGLDKIANGKYIWHQLCETCYTDLTKVVNDLQHLKKFSLEIDEKHTLVIGKHGPVIKCLDNNNKVYFLPIKKDLDIDQLQKKYEEKTLILDEIIDNSIANKESIGKYKGKDLFIKSGKYGVYAQWGNETKALKEEKFQQNIENIPYIDVIKYLDKDTVLDPEKPVGFVRELNNHLSIRTGKYGDYIFYKKPRMKKPSFYKLIGFKEDYKKCDKMSLLKWIKETYNVE